jgi:hypothetical protein
MIRATLAREMTTGQQLPKTEKDGVAALLGRAHEIEPQSAIPFAIAAACLVWGGDLPLAEENAKRALALDPGSVEARLVLSQINSQILSQSFNAANVKPLPRDKALSELLKNFALLGVPPVEAIGLLFRAVIGDLSLAICALLELSPNLSENERTWILPWVSDADRVSRLAEAHSAMLESTSTVPSGTNSTVPMWSGSTN